jgi:hypothetical protein
MAEVETITRSAFVSSIRPPALALASYAGGPPEYSNTASRRISE